MLPASSSRTVPAVTSWPLSMTTTWLQTCSISDRRWLDSSTVDALLREPPEQLAHRAHLLGVEAVGRLVEQEQLGPAEQHPREAEALAHALRVRLHPALDRVARARRPRAHPRGPPRTSGAPPASHHSRRFRMPERCGTNAACSIIVPTRASSGAPGRTGRSNRRASPAVGRISPTSIRSAVVLPAPLGPSSPQTWPRLDLEVEPRDRLHAAVALRQAAHGDHRLSVIDATLGRGSRRSGSQRHEDPVKPPAR